MRYLLDTCALLWLALGDKNLSAKARGIIDDSSGDGFVSVVSLWEISMKAVTGKLSIALTPMQLSRLAEGNGLSVVELSVAHIDRFNLLPVSHRDAFDRLLAAIAIEEGLTLLTPDSTFDNLGVQRDW